VGIEARVEVGGDRQAQDDVSQECEALIGIRATADPRSVRERLAREIIR
jgi:hypothetical protein